MYRYRALSVFLWLAVFGWAIWVGGTAYQMLVVVPMWSSSPPASVQSFFINTEYNRTIYNFFGPPFMAGRMLPVIISLLLAWSLPRIRMLLGIATLCLITAIVFTIVYVYPLNAVLFFEAGGSGSAEEIRLMVSKWIWADRARFVIGLVAFIAILRAFQAPLPASGNPAIDRATSDQ